MSEKRVVEAGRLTGKAGGDSSNAAGGRLRLACGGQDVENPDGAQGDAHFHWERFKNAASTFICFRLSVWSLAYRSKRAASASTLTSDTLTVVAWSFCRSSPSFGAPWDFCQRISHDANLIHNVGRMFRNQIGRSTIDAIL